MPFYDKISADAMKDEEVDYIKKSYEKELSEKDDILAEKDTILAEKDKEIEILKAKLHENGMT